MTDYVTVAVPDAISADVDVMSGPPGPKGDKGDTGPQGPQGATGATGAQGATGATGAQGAKGDPGDLTPSDYATGWGGSLSLASWVAPITKVRVLGSNATIVDLPPSPGATKAATVTLVVKQPATGGPFTVTFPASAEWANDAAAPAMPTAANAELIVHMFWTGQAWRLMYAGSFFP